MDSNPMQPSLCFPGCIRRVRRKPFPATGVLGRARHMMRRRDFETILLTLESTPVLLARAAAALSPSESRRRPGADCFSFVENVWHLADLEREGFGLRIRRILAEE